MDMLASLKKRQELISAGDSEGLAVLDSEALNYIKDVLEGKFLPETETSPLFYSFFTSFSQTGNAGLKTACKQALLRLQPLLDKFDAENGLDRTEKLDTEILNRNLAALNAFEQINPFELDNDGQLKFSEFSDLFLLTNNIDITDSSGRKSDSAHTKFLETLIESARLKTFMKLSLQPEEATQEIYLSELRWNMEKDLVLMFVVEHVNIKEGFSEKTKDLIEEEYQKLLHIVQEG